ncbi:hypothetical protein RR46_12095 [Papilio xuthus]|uniref:Uncharacterized protein n=1 Tax=Papilio xuthus TaxID=66420 RepID=A0A194PNT5_PAPXU|nr:hypothetical protein RR46_12095 [Papilio xuthus]
MCDGVAASWPSCERAGSAARGCCVLCQLHRCQSAHNRAITVIVNTADSDSRQRSHCVHFDKCGLVVVTIKNIGTHTKNHKYAYRTVTITSANVRLLGTTILLRSGFVPCGDDSPPARNTLLASVGRPAKLLGEQTLVGVEARVPLRILEGTFRQRLSTQGRGRGPRIAILVRPKNCVTRLVITLAKIEDKEVGKVTASKVLLWVRGGALWQINFHNMYTSAPTRFTGTNLSS